MPEKNDLRAMNKIGNDIREDRMSKKYLASVFCALILPVIMSIPSPAWSAQPTDALKPPIDAVIKILNDPQYKAGGTKSAQRKAIWKTIKGVFDFNEIARRAVARDWRRFSEAQKKTFADVFSQFLGNTYIDKIQGEYHNEKIVYVGQEVYEGRYAEVRTKMVRESVQTPIYYRMMKESDGQWKVYDVIVEGVSLVKNYRTQFASILRKEKPDQLIERLKKKLVEQNNRLSEEG
jgi:phospholipid transport system substrate-binding protein